MENWLMCSFEDVIAVTRWPPGDNAVQLDDFDGLRSPMRRQTMWMLLPSWSSHFDTGTISQRRPWKVVSGGPCEDVIYVAKFGWNGQILTWSTTSWWPTIMSERCRWDAPTHRLVKDHVKGWLWHGLGPAAAIPVKSKHAQKHCAPEYHCII